MKNIQYYNAGAGSGKTFKLTELLYLAIKEKEVRADEVILTTFTKAAAKEIRERARKKLLEEGMHEEAVQLNNALIGTVHSVAQQITSKFWYKLGLPAKSNVISAIDDDLVLNEAIVESISVDDEQEMSEICVALHYKNSFGTSDPDKWRTFLKDIIKKSRSYFIDDFTESKEKSIEELHLVFHIPEDYDLNVDPKMLSEKLSVIKDLVTSDKPSGKRTERLDFIKEIENSDVATVGIAKILNWIAGLPAKNTKNAEVERYAEIAGFYAIKEVKGILLRFIELLFKNAGAVKKSYNELKKRRKLQDYNDMEFYFSKLLEQEDVKNELKERYKLILVDEFQDSSPIQVKIFNELSNILNKSIWVGDMKQSIYGFRGSDTELVGKVLEDLNKGSSDCEVKNELTHSWRSRSALVHLVNHLFVPVFESQGIERDFIPLKPKREKDSEFGDQSGLQHWHFMTGGNHRTLQAAQLANEVKNLLASNIPIFDKEQEEFRSIWPKDVSILTDSNNNLNTTKQALAEIGVPVKTVAPHFNETVEIALIKALLNLIIDPRDTLARSEIAFLSMKDGLGEFINQRVEFIKSDHPSSTWAEDHPFVSYVLSLQKSWSKLSVSEILNRLIEDLHLREFTAQFGNEQYRNDNINISKKAANHYEEYCQQMGTAASITGFINFVSETDLSEFRGSGEENAVSVMTYHGAKGLEWPVVILDALNRGDLSENKLIEREWFGLSVNNPENLSITDPFKDRCLTLIPEVKSIANELKEAIKKTNRFANILLSSRAEKTRLLYVAMTRARDYMITTSVNNTKPGFMQDLLGAQIGAQTHELKIEGNWIDWYETNNGDLNVFTKLLDYSEFELKVVDQNKGYEYEIPETKKQDDPLFRNPSDQKATECKVEVIKDFEHRITLADTAKLDMGKLGDLLHAAFFLYKSTIKKNDYINKLGGLIEQSGFENIIVEGSEIFLTVKNLYDMLETKYGSAIKVYKELPMQVNLDGYIYKGEADLVWETEEGYVLIDYKSFPGTDLQIINPKDTFYAGKYSGQLETYKRMIEEAKPEKEVIGKLVYYAVSGLLVELIET